MSEKIQEKKKQKIRTASVKSRGENIDLAGKQLFSCVDSLKPRQVRQHRCDRSGVHFLYQTLGDCYIWPLTSLNGFAGTV